jgi:hypothetical protein
MQQGQGTGNGLSVLATSLNLAATNILIAPTPNCFILSTHQVPCMIRLLYIYGFQQVGTQEQRAPSQPN